jgi:hypothetical protein
MAMGYLFVRVYSIDGPEYAHFYHKKFHEAFHVPVATTVHCKLYPERTKHLYWVRFISISRSGNSLYKCRALRFWRSKPQ